MKELHSACMNGKYFAKLIKPKFPEALEETINPRAKCILQDGDLAQNSRKASHSFTSTGAKVFKIPARSPDLNPIENVFHLIRRKLVCEARVNHIVKENIEEFSNRVENILLSYTADKIDKIIDTMSKRLNMILKVCRQRIKY